MDDQTPVCENSGTINERKTDHKDKTVFESSNNIRFSQELSSCNILNTEIPDNSQNCRSRETDSQKHKKDKSATDLQLSVTENSEKSRSPVKESGCVNEPHQYSSTQHSDEYCDLPTDKRSQKNTASIFGNNEANVDVSKKNEDEHNCISSKLSPLSNQLNILTENNSLDTLAHASTLLHTSNDETYSFLDPNGDGDASYNGSSLQYMQQQTVEDSLAECVDKSKHPLPDFNEETSLSHASNDFQPIILDVRGGYCEMEMEDGTQSQSSANLEASEIEHTSTNESDQSTNTFDVAEDNSFSKPAFQLLQGMAEYAMSSSKKTSKANVSKITNAVSSTDNVTLHSNDLVSEVNANFTSTRGDNSQVKSLHTNTSSALNNCTPLSSRRSTQPFSVNCPRSITATSKALPPAVVASSTSNESQTARHRKAHSNPQLSNAKGTTYSFVFVQNKNNLNQGQVALLIPQSSLPGIGKVCSVGASDVAKSTVSDISVDAVHNGQASSPPSLQEHIPNSSMSVMESITKLVTNTVNNFCVQGKDLKDSNLLKITLPKENGCSQYPVSCSVCGEGYHDVQGLKFHQERTVFHLTYHCSVCKQNIVFFNKCSLWVHLKSETEEPVLNYFNILCLKPYEFDTNDESESQEREAGGTDSSEASAVSPCVTNVSNKDGNLPKTTALVEEVITTKLLDQCAVSDLSTLSGGNNNFCSLLKCSVCLLKFPNLTSHLCPTMQRKCLCSSCGMFLPSICAQEAHMKIHSGVVKDISCPECGKNDFNTAQESEDLRCVFDHIDSCKHFNRILNLKCFCNQEVTNVNHLLKHFTDKHCRTLFKCPLCVLAFTQYSHLVGHLDKVHKTKDTSIKASVLCLFCQQIIKSAEELKGHVDQHVEQFKDSSVFKWKCFICFKLYVDKSDLNNHLEKDHPHKSKRCTICYSLFWSRKNLVEHIVQKKCLRFLAQKLNCCVDHQPEVSEVSVDFSKLFEAQEAGPSCHEEKQQLGVMSLTSKRNLVNIAPKPVSNQPEANKQNNPSHCLSQKITPAEVLTQHKQTLLGFSASNDTFTNKAPPQQCKIIITGKSNSTEPGKQIEISVSQCVVCMNLIDNKKLQDHLSFHQSQGVIICSVCQRRDFTELEGALKHSSTCLNKNFETEECQKSSEPQSSSTADVTSEANNEERHLDTENNEQTQVDTDKINVESQSLFPCLLCGLAFQSLSSREEHISRLHDGTRMVYHCGICRKRGKSSIFSKKELVSRHITKKHRVVNMDSVNRLIRTEEQNVSNGQKLPVSEPVPEESVSVSPPKRLRVAGEGDYMCGKCGFSCCNSEEFSQHITAHNTAQEPQCPECGLCFTIFHALKKHLLAVHKIKAVDNYLKMKNITEPEVEEEEEMEIVREICPSSKVQPELQEINSKSNTKVSPSNPLECTVCYKVFDIETNLKTHMRNHGMAFIRSKRHKR